MRRFAACVGLLVCSQALAQPTPSARVKTDDGRSFRFYYSADKLRVSRGKRSASTASLGLPWLAPFAGIKASAKGNQVTIRGENICGPTSANVDADRLDARIENADGYRRLKAGKADEAAARFAKAMALDPTFVIAATNLASVQVADKKLAEAEKTIAKSLGSRPIKTAFKVFADSDLEPLRKSKTMTGLAKVAGTAKLDWKGNLTEPLAYSKSRDWLAFVLVETPGAADCSDRRALVFTKRKSGTELHRQPINTWDEVASGRDCYGTRIPRKGRDKARARVAALNAVLAAYGFDPVASERGVQGDRNDKLHFNKAKVGVVAGKNGITAFRSAKSVGKAGAGGFDIFERGHYADSINTAVVFWSYDCAHNADESFYAVVPVKPKP